MKNFLSLYRFLLPILFISSSAALAFAAPGDLDSSFGAGGIVTTDFGGRDTAHAIARQSDGKLIVAGQKEPVGTNFDFALARYNADGSLDSSFGTGGKVTTDFFGDIDTIRSVVVQADGKIVAGGFSRTAATPFGYSLARYNANGTLDASFGTGGKVTTVIWGNDDELAAILLQPDGKILAIGLAATTPTRDFGVVRYNSNGSLDTTFGTGGKATADFSGRFDLAYAAALQPDGKIIAGGYTVGASDDGNNVNFAVARFTADGSLDTSFGSGGKVTTDFASLRDEIRSLAVQADGKIIAAGSTGNNNNSGTVNFALARYDAGGGLDNSFGSGGKVTTDFPSQSSYADIAYAVSVQANGKIVAAGQGANQFALARYQSGGALDTTFGSGGKVTTAFAASSSLAESVLIQPDGKIVAAGSVSPSGDPFATNFVTARYLGDAAQSYRAPFDFDGDSKTDIGIFRPNSGEWWINRSASNQTTAVQFGQSSDKPVPADFTGDGKTDIAFWRESSGQWFIIRSEDSSFYAFPFGTNGDIPSPSDFDGDGKADAAVFRPSNATWYIQRSSDNQVTAVQFGISEDKPTPSDFDGDGRADIAIFRPSVAEWWILKSSGGIRAVQFGQTGDKAALGDYTGDGKADIAFWRPSTGFWYILRSEDSSYYGFPFGLNGDVPTPGDFDGDGKFDAAVFRPSNSTWYLQRSTSGFTAIGFGIAGDQPLPSSFVR